MVRIIVVEWPVWAMSFHEYDNGQCAVALSIGKQEPMTFMCDSLGQAHAIAQSHVRFLRKVFGYE